MPAHDDRARLAELRSPPIEWESTIRDVRCRYGHAMRYTVKFMQTYEEGRFDHMLAFASCRMCQRDFGERSYQLGWVMPGMIAWWALPNKDVQDELYSIVMAAESEDKGVPIEMLVELVNQRWHTTPTRGSA